MMTWARTLSRAALGTALGAALALGACGPDARSGVAPDDIDEAAIAAVQADLEGWLIAGVACVRPSSGVPQPPVNPGRRIDPDLDERSIRRHAARLSEAEVEILLDRMRAKKRASARID